MNAIRLSMVLFLLRLANNSLQNEQVPKVKTPIGSLRGYYKTSQHGRTYEAYEGVPYAQPPVGKLRFKPPEPVEKWEEELPATKQSSFCIQYSLLNEFTTVRITGCEDCLYMNIYVPVRNSNETLLPVMFWIHGGGFLMGSGNFVNETSIMDRDVILVTINYRLGPFGFLSTGDSVVPGNMGLKDQNLALRWVSNNIRSFGGNPKEVTIFGVSAGGASVHYHYLSQLSVGLFQRGISISGVALDPWAQTERAPENAKKLGALMGCPTGNTALMIRCLRNRPPRVITQAVGNFMPWLYYPLNPFAPVVDKYGFEPFISQTPVNIINRGEVQDIPWISGVVRDEGAVFVAGFATNNQLLQQLNDDWDDIAPYLLIYNDTIPQSQQREVGEEIRRYYLGSNEINNSTLMPLVRMIGDRHFGVDFENATRLQAKVNRSPVWTYYYTYRAAHSITEFFSGSSINLGVSHTDDSTLALGPGDLSTLNPEDSEMQQTLLDFYTSFAIQGTPRAGNAKWQPLNSDEQNFDYLHIVNPRNMSMESNNNFAQSNFWNTIDFNENRIST